MESQKLFETFYNDKKLIDSKRKVDLESYIYTEMKKNKVLQLDSPILVGIKVTNKCNFNCIHCFSSQESPQSMELGEFKNIINNISKARPYKIYITGGEPFLNPYIFDMISYIKMFRNKLSIHTNASILDLEEAITLKKIMRNDDFIQVSIDGYDEKTFKLTRNNNHFNKVIRVVEALVKNDIKVKVNTVVTNVNVHFIDKIYDLATQLGVNEISFSPLLNSRRIDNVYLPEDKIIIENFALVLERYVKSGKRIKISQDPIAVPWGNKIINKFTKDHKLVCPAGKTAMEIDCNGDVFPCPFLYFDTFKMGNLLSEDIDTVWKRDKDSILKKDTWSTNKKCVQCGSYDSCGGGCIAAAYVENKQYDPRCEYASSGSC
jgi:radical SAM protein with 4Fe4S-binding SPASM domain